ncbi:hypothetical protein EST38_g12555 [Candolleomyces aberdarensis]|uniref:Uncharacterized protein n=1 Tax=Candolleomyces aberdarensis TaxID=2316362 RepID=A0A4Q2D256_9AGAR|nr:hypothetical protein EST38_g12555 [Candolleomyces aberdarensis]
MDDLATGIYTIHWHGTKLWLLWPSTQENHRKMEDIRLDMPTLEASLSLIETLGGLELMYLTREEYIEFSFYLLPNTIHCCLSFTESCHSGSYVWSPKFVSQAKTIVDWELEWINSAMDAVAYADPNMKKAIVVDFLTSMCKWESVANKKGIDPSMKKIIKDMVRRGRNGIQRQASIHGIM